ncbi:transketolase [Chloroflexota bacterium]
MVKKITELEKKANYIRNQVLDMCVKAGTGHVTSSFSCTEILVALYYGEILNNDASNPKWEDRDRFILSKGHASPILYAILADLDFFSESEIWKFAQADGIFGVHLQHDIPGVEITAGSLGHGLGIAAGIALAAKMDKKHHLTFVLLGDGECYEGSVWESAMFAGHHELNNLIAIVDRNWLSATDFTENYLRLNPLDEKWKSFGWKAITINGHSFEDIFSSLGQLHSMYLNKPLVIIANTIKGKGVTFMENQPLWHSIAPTGNQAELAKAELTKREIE